MGSEYARVLNLFWKQLSNNFKFKNPEETLKNKICSKCMWPETWILFLALNNAYFLRVLGTSLRNNAPPTILLPPISPTLLTLVCQPRQPRQHTNHLNHADTPPTSPTLARIPRHFSTSKEWIIERKNNLKLR